MALTKLEKEILARLVRAEISKGSNVKIACLKGMSRGYKLATVRGYYKALS